MANNYKVVMGDIGSDLSEKFYSNLKRSVKIEKSTTGTEIDLDWISKIEEAVPYIDNIFDSPKRFIISEEEILNVEKSKKVTVQTIKHLSKHSNFISEFDEETNNIRPSKLLNELKEETFNTYENRFIYTLVDLLDSFIRHMEDKINEINYNKNNVFETEATSNVKDEEIKYKVKLESSKKIDSLDGDDDFNFRLSVIKSNISAWKQNVVYTSLKKEKATKVTSPLKRTNVILKNPNFKIAANLWDYLNAFRDQEKELDRQPETINELPPNLQKLVDNSILMYYLIMKMSTTNNQYQIDAYKKYTKDVAMEVLGETTEILMSTDSDITKEDVINTIAEKYNQVKYKKTIDNKAVETKIKNTIKKFIEKVDGSYFELESGESNEKQNI